MALTDSTGNVVESYTYDVYGQPSILSTTYQLLPTSSVTNRFLFTGREYLAELALYDYRHRIYSPSLGRFLQTDPLRFDAEDVNLYRYVGNGVVLRLDPDGNVEWAPFLRGATAAAFGTMAFVGGAALAATGAGTGLGIAGMLLGGPTAAGGLAMMIEAWNDNPNAKNIPTSVPQMVVKPVTQNLPPDKAKTIETVADAAADIPMAMAGGPNAFWGWLLQHLIGYSIDELEEFENYESEYQSGKENSCN